MSPRSALVRTLAVLALSVPAAAEGLVQIALEGRIAAPGGARVELAVTARVAGESRRAALELHLAQGTDAHAVVALLADRARARDLALLFPGEHAGAGAGSAARADLFLADALSVELRLPAGLVGRIVACEGVPTLVRLLPPQLLPGGPGTAGEARLLLAATTHHVVTGLHGQARIEFELPADGSAVRASERLFTRTIEAGWVADRPANDAWRPVRVGENGQVRGLSVEILTEGPDWGLVLELEPSRQ